MMRGAGGSEDHPDATLFAGIFRLLSMYSLIKPPRGSNVSGAEILQALISLKDVSDEKKRRKSGSIVLI